MTDTPPHAPSICVRPAVLEDAQALSALKLAAFRETFLEEGFAVPYPPADLAGFEQASYGLETVTAELANTRHASWVAQAEDGALVAYAHCGPCHLPHAEASEEQGQLYQIYLLRSHQGYRLGGKLMTLAMDWLAATYPGPVWLGVWSGNEKAQVFYSKLGFRKVGDYHFMVGDHADEEFIFRRD